MKVKAPAPPGPSPEELRAQQQQNEANQFYFELAKQNAAREAALEPLMLKKMGITKIVNPDGSITYQENAPTAEEAQDKEIQRLSNERILKGLKGELDVDPAVEADLQRGREQAAAILASRGITPGSGDVWNRAMGEFERNANALRYSVRHGEMSTADALARSRNDMRMQREGFYTGQVRGGAEAAGAGYAGAANLFDRYAAPQRAIRMQDWQNRVNAANQNTQMWNSLIGGGIGGGLQAGGQIGGAYLLSSGLKSAALIGGCWIAEVIYGTDAAETRLLRLWLNTLGSESVFGSLGMRLYRRFGRKLAAWLQRHPWAKRPVKWYFDRLLVQACRDLVVPA